MAEREISKLSVLLLFNTRNFEQKLSEVQMATKKTGQAMTRAGQQIALGMSVPLAVAGKAITDTATSFEYQMARVQAISGATSQSFVRLQRNAEELGATTIYQATAVGQLQEEYAKLGFVASEITAVTESTLSLAQVTGADLGRAAEIAGSTLRIFGKDVSEVGQVNDVIAVAISQSALDFESFAETMKYAGSQAAISNVSMEEISAAMGVLANRGVKGSIAGTRLRMILAKLAEEGGNTHDKFIELINGTMTMTEAIDRFGVRAASAVPVLQANRDEFFALESSMIQSAGTLQAMQETMDDTAYAVQRRFISALENLSIQFGKVLLPIVNLVLEAVIALVGGIAELPGPIKFVVVAIGGLITIGGPLLFLFGQIKLMLLDMTLLFPNLGMAMSTMFGPVGLAVVAVTALVAGLIHMMMTGDEVISMQERLSAANAEAGESAGKVLAPIRSLIYEYENENTTIERKQRILKELERSQPKYFKNLDTETTTVQGLESAYDKLSDSIKRNAKIRALQSQITQVVQEQGVQIGKQVAAEAEIDDIERRRAAGETGYVAPVSVKSGARGVDLGIEKLVKQRDIIDEAQQEFDRLQRQLEKLQGMVDEAGGLDGLGDESSQTVFTGEMGDEISDLEKVMSRLNKKLFGLNQETVRLGTDGLDTAEGKLSAFTSAFGQLSDLMFEGTDVGAQMAYVTKNIKELQAVVGDQTSLQLTGDAMNDLNAALERIREQFDTGLIDAFQLQDAQMQAYENAINALLPILGAEHEIVQDLADSYGYLAEQRRKNNDATEEQNTTTQQGNQLTQQTAQILYNLSAGLGEAIGNSQSFGQTMVQAMKQAAVATLNLVFTQMLQNAMNPQNKANQATLGLAGLAAATAGLGILTGLVNSIKIPALAQGGITNGPQLALVGDNRSGREAIIPLEKLPSLMAKMGGVGGSRVYGQLSGYDIALSSDRSGKRMQRISY